MSLNIMPNWNSLL